MELCLLQAIKARLVLSVKTKKPYSWVQQGQFFLNISDPNVLETLACREALALAEDFDLCQVGITSDCQGFIRDLADASGGSNTSVIREINEYSLRLAAVRFMHERRQYTVEAHNLARAATSLDLGRHLWL
jgi:hypothetical protein